MTSARRVAFAALSKWRTGKKFADSIISDLLERSNLPSQERAFALELFYGVLRNLTLLDFWIAQLRRSRIELRLRDLLRLGIYQAFLIETPPYAAVNETVELAPNNQRPIVNAILRNAVRKRDDLRHRADQQPLSVQWSHPEFLVSRWQKNFGDKAALDLCAWNNRPAQVYVRINRLKISPDDFLRAHSGSFLLPNRENFAGISSGIPEATAAGQCYVQDPSTAMACELLDPQPGENVLDACAAPGGKTSYIAELMQNRGTLVACERDPERFQLLGENLSRLGVSIARVVQHDWEQSTSHAEIHSSGPFDRILVDAPCSNTGVMRRRVDVRWRLQPGDFVGMQQRQGDIVNAVIPLLKRGGVLVYSTCSIEPEENQSVAEAIGHRVNQEKQEQLLPFRDHVDGAFTARFVSHC